MIGVEQETNFDALRQKAVLLDRENDRLHRQLRKLAREIMRLRGDDETSDQLYLDLVSKLEKELAKTAPAGQSPDSESSSEGNDSPPDEQPDGETPKRKGHGPRSQPALPVQLILHELTEAELTCDQCGATCSPMGKQVESSEVVNVVRRQFVLEVHNRQKYRCQCNAKILTAPGPERLIPGGRYSIDFAIEVAVAKYLDHLPLERQAVQMGREGLTVTSQTLWNQIDRLAERLRPCADHLWTLQMREDVLGVDETRWPMLDGKTSNYSVLGTCSPRISAYRILSSKSEKDIGLALAEHQGIKVADGYKVYENLTRAGPGEPVRLANCWAHAFRKFKAIEDDHPDKCGEILGLIGELFTIEKRTRPFPGDAEAQADRLRLRDTESRRIVSAIKDWAVAAGLTTLPRSRLGKAIRYIEKRWPALELFLTDPRIPLDNNGVERALRGLVVGRKNHYGSKSRRGTLVASVFYSLLETCKINAVDPHEYLRQAVDRDLAGEGPITPLDLIEG